MPLSPSTPSKLPTTKSAWRSGHAASSETRDPLIGGTPSGSVRVPRLMSPTNARLTDRAEAAAALRESRSGSERRGVGGATVSRAGHGPSGRRRLGAGAQRDERDDQRGARRHAGAGRPRSWPSRASAGGSAPDPPPSSSSFTGSDTVEPVRATRIGCMASPELEAVGLGRLFSDLENAVRGPVHRPEVAPAPRRRAAGSTEKAGPIFRIRASPFSESTLEREGSRRTATCSATLEDGARARLDRVDDRARSRRRRSTPPMRSAGGGRGEQLVGRQCATGTARSSTRAWWCRTPRPSSGCPPA